MCYLPHELEWLLSIIPQKVSQIASTSPLFFVTNSLFVLVPLSFSFLEQGVRTLAQHALLWPGHSTRSALQTKWQVWCSCVREPSYPSLPGVFHSVWIQQMCVGRGSGVCVCVCVGQWITIIISRSPSKLVSVRTCRFCLVQLHL